MNFKLKRIKVIFNYLITKKDALEKSIRNLDYILKCNQE